MAKQFIYHSIAATMAAVISFCHLDDYLQPYAVEAEAKPKFPPQNQANLPRTDGQLPSQYWLEYLEV